MDGLTDALGSSHWTYALILALVAGDAVLPLLPGETAVITGAILATQGRLLLPLVLLAAFAGAVLGDQAGYWLGRGVLQHGLRRLTSSGKGSTQIAWARDQLHRRGPVIIVAGRFIPGGRTATNVASGSVEMPWRRFTPADLLAAGLWSAVETGIGVAGGAAFRDSTVKPLLVSLVFGALLALLGLLLRKRLTPGDDADDGARPGRRRRPATHGGH